MSEHPHHHHPSPDHNRAFAVGIALNVAFVIAEVIYGFQANSLALLADAGHNASDVLGLVMAWGAILLAKRKPSERFTYGLQSASIFAALANALLLLVAIGGIGLEALQRFIAPPRPDAMTVIAVAAIGVLINGLTAWLFYKGNQRDLNIRGAFLHMATDAAISFGVVLSGLLIMATGLLWLDPLVSLIIVIVIADSTWKLFRHSLSLALHGVPNNINLQEVKEYLGALNGVAEVHDLHIWGISTTGIALSAHLVMPGGHPGDEFIHTLSHALESRYGIHHATFQIEIGDAKMGCHSGCGHHEHAR